MDDDGGVTKELLALFSNPQLSRQAQQLGLRPLSFGQDIKHLLRSMDMRDIAIEPAATLRDGVEREIFKAFPRVKQIIDVTDHTSGDNPYYA